MKFGMVPAHRRIVKMRLSVCFLALLIFSVSAEQQIPREDYSEVRQKSEEAMLDYYSGTEKGGIYDGKTYHLGLALSPKTAELYYMKDEEKILINTDLDVKSKESIEGALADGLGYRSLVEAVAVVDTLIQARMLKDGQPSEKLSFDISEFLDSETEIDHEDAREILLEMRFYFARDTLSRAEIMRLSTKPESGDLISVPEITEITNRTELEEGKEPTRVKRKMSTSGSNWNPSGIDYRFRWGHFNTAQRNIIRDAIDHWEDETCLNFNEVTSWWPFNKITFADTTANICGSSPVGKKWYGNRIRVKSSNSNCMTVGVVAHEIGHSIGFWHEHTRPDRNNYVTINWGNIPSGSQHNYFIKTWGNTYTYGIPYDYSSVMHYADGPAITLIDPSMTWTVGQTEGLSFRDSKLANFHYCKTACGGSSLVWSACQHAGYRDPNNCDKCRCPTGWTGTHCQSKDTEAVCGSSSLTATPAIQVLNSPSTTGAVECAWLITAPASHKVYAKFTGSFSLRGWDVWGACVDDYVEIRWNNINQIGARRCGSSLPTNTYESSNTQMMVVFKSDNLLASQGFSLQYWTRSCGLCGGPSSYSPAEPCYSTHQETCSVQYTYNCGWWGRKCTGYRYHTCYKSVPYCCHGTVVNGQCSVGCGGCSNTYIENQPSCTRTITKYKSQSYVSYYGCGWWRRCSRIRYRQQAVQSYEKYCCNGYTLNASKTRCIK